MVVRKNHLDALAVSMLLGCSLFWGFQQVLVKATLAEMPGVFQASVRFVCATGVLMLWCAWRRIALFERDGTLLPGLLAGSLFAAEFACIYIGLQHTTASRSTVFLYTSPFWVALLLPLRVPSEKLKPLQWLGLACAFVAVAFALREGFGATGARSTWLGDLICLGGALFWGLTTVVMRSSSLMRVSAEKLLFYQVSVSACMLPLLSLALGEAWSLHLSPFVITSLALQTLVGACVSYLAWMWMLKRYPATRISVFVFFTPLFALLFGTLWLGEPVTASLIAALVLVAGGIVLVNRR